MSKTLNRRATLELMGGSALLAGCGNGAGLMARSMLPGDKPASGLAKVVKSVRTGVAFPQARPDGSIPATRGGAKVAASVARAGSPVGDTIVCPPSGCGGGGDGGGGNGPTLPSYSSTVGGAAAHCWTPQNYGELWDVASDNLMGQLYWSGSGTVLTCEFVSSSGMSATASIDTAAVSSNGTTSFSDGMTIAVSAPNRTYTVTGGNLSTSAVVSTSNILTLTSLRSIGTPYRSTGSGNMFGSFTFSESNPAVCIAVAIVASAVLLAVIAAAVAAVVTACAGTDGLLCQAAFAVAAGLVAEAIAIFHDTINRACS